MNVNETGKATESLAAAPLPTLEKEAVKSSAFADEVISEALCEDIGDSHPCVLFICTGNTCRSPMAEAYMKSRGYKTAFSRGLFDTGAPISDKSVTTLKSHGINPAPDNNYTDHISKTVAAGDIARADIVLAMTNEQLTTLIFSFPQFSDKLGVMPGGIPDPYGGDQKKYDEALEAIISALDEMFFTGGSTTGNTKGDE
ncbi:MAG: hypothetical protein LUH54_03360 [Firmicutes bacterium]|nr:hypothetical protein [Bacillota bacterium]